MALNKSRANCDIFDTGNLLDSEKKMFNDLVGLLGNFRDNILTNLLELKQPYSEPEEASTAEEPQTDTSSESAPTVETESKSIKVNFLTEIIPFVSKDLETYGPYSTGESAEIPRDVAEILIKNGKAKAL